MGFGPSYVQVLYRLKLKGIESDWVVSIYEDCNLRLGTVTGARDGDAFLHGKLARVS